VRLFKLNAQLRPCLPHEPPVGRESAQEPRVQDPDGHFAGDHWQQRARNGQK